MTRDVRCPECGTLFGRESSPETLQIKVREVIRQVTGGVVEGPCRRCRRDIKWPEPPQSRG